MQGNQGVADIVKGAGSHATFFLNTPNQIASHPARALQAGGGSTLPATSRVLHRQVTATTGQTTVLVPPPGMQTSSSGNQSDNSSVNGNSNGQSHGIPQHRLGPSSSSGVTSPAALPSPGLNALNPTSAQLAELSAFSSTPAIENQAFGFHTLSNGANSHAASMGVAATRGRKRPTAHFTPNVGVLTSTMSTLQTPHAESSVFGGFADIGSLASRLNSPQVMSQPSNNRAFPRMPLPQPGDSASAELLQTATRIMTNTVPFGRQDDQPASGVVAFDVLLNGETALDLESNRTPPFMPPTPSNDAMRATLGLSRAKQGYESPSIHPASVMPPRLDTATQSAPNGLEPLSSDVASSPTLGLPSDTGNGYVSSLPRTEARPGEHPRVFSIVTMPTTASGGVPDSAGSRMDPNQQNDLRRDSENAEIMAAAHATASASAARMAHASMEAIAAQRPQATIHYSDQFAPDQVDTKVTHGIAPTQGLEYQGPTSLTGQIRADDRHLSNEPQVHQASASKAWLRTSSGSELPVEIPRALHPTQFDNVYCSIYSHPELMAESKQLFEAQRQYEEMREARRQEQKRKQDAKVSSAGHGTSAAAAAARNSKGLRHFSLKVCETVRRLGVTTYNHVADTLVETLAEQDVDDENEEDDEDDRQGDDDDDEEGRKGQRAKANKRSAGSESKSKSAANKSGAYQEKNIRRRVYDALNVLMALGTIEKCKKQIRWRAPSLPTRDGTSDSAADGQQIADDLESQASAIVAVEFGFARELEDLRTGFELTQAQLAKKVNYARSLMRNYLALKTLIDRNRALAYRASKQAKVSSGEDAVESKEVSELSKGEQIPLDRYVTANPNAKIRLPFILVTSPEDDTGVVEGLDNDGSHVMLSFVNEPQVLKDIDVLEPIVTSKLPFSSGLTTDLQVGPVRVTTEQLYRYDSAGLGKTRPRAELSQSETLGQNRRTRVRLATQEESEQMSDHDTEDEPIQWKLPSFDALGLPSDLSSLATSVIKDVQHMISQLKGSDGEYHDRDSVLQILLQDSEASMIPFGVHDPNEVEAQPMDQPQAPEPTDHARAAHGRSRTRSSASARARQASDDTQSRAATPHNLVDEHGFQSGSRLQAHHVTQAPFYTSASSGSSSSGTLPLPSTHGGPTIGMLPSAASALRGPLSPGSPPRPPRGSQNVVQLSSFSPVAGNYTLPHVAQLPSSPPRRPYVSSVGLNPGVGGQTPTHARLASGVSSLATSHASSSMTSGVQSNASTPAAIRVDRYTLDAVPGTSRALLSTNPARGLPHLPSPGGLQWNGSQARGIGNRAMHQNYDPSMHMGTPIPIHGGLPHHQTPGTLTPSHVGVAGGNASAVRRGGQIGATALLTSAFTAAQAPQSQRTSGGNTPNMGPRATATTVAGSATAASSASALNLASSGSFSGSVGVPNSASAPSSASASLNLKQAGASRSASGSSSSLSAFDPSLRGELLNLPTSVTDAVKAIRGGRT